MSLLAMGEAICLDKNAKYGAYCLMSTGLNKIVDFLVVHVSTAGNSSRINKKGLKTLLENVSGSMTDMFK